jgi:hypothetical protein
MSGAVDWALPSCARLWVILAANPREVTMRHRSYAALETAMLFGVASRGMSAPTFGGVSAVIDVGPGASARLGAPSAELLRDRITPLSDVLPRGWSDDLVAGIADRIADRRSRGCSTTSSPSACRRTPTSR